MTPLEARHRPALNEGQKENIRRENFEQEEDIRKLAEKGLRRELA